MTLSIFWFKLHYRAQISQSRLKSRSENFYIIRLILVICMFIHELYHITQFPQIIAYCDAFIFNDMTIGLKIRNLVSRCIYSDLFCLNASRI